MTFRLLPDQYRDASTYLGDGLYACVEHGMVVLFATNGIHIHDAVYLEPSVLKAFKEFIAGIEKEKE